MNPAELALSPGLSPARGERRQATSLSPCGRGIEGEECFTLSGRHLIFDLDGTLVDSAPAILAGFRKILAEAGISPVTPIDSKLIGPPLLSALATITGSSDQELLQSLAGQFKNYYDQDGYRETAPFPGISELLEGLSMSGAKLHIATNKRWRPTTAILNLLQWQKHFCSIYAQDKVVPGYPNKSTMLRHLLTEQAIDPGSAMYIGDTVEDGVAAAENNLVFIAVDWGYGSFDNWCSNGAWIHVSLPHELLEAANAM
jgi:phosphoglycolate phosphatase